MRPKSIKQVVNHNLCVGCGLCSLDKNVKMKESGGMIQPDSVTNYPTIEASCPSKGYNLKGLGKRLFGDINYCPEIGYYREICMAHSRNAALLKNASSGGIMTEIASSMLEKGLVNGVITTKFVFNNDKVRTETYVATSEKELINGQGSKYCPTSTLTILNQLDYNKKYLLIGTPCQVAGFRMYSEHDNHLREMVPYTIANFCGGYRDYKELDYFVKDVAHVKTVSFFRHRGGGQPGSMRIEGEHGELFQYPYPDYAKLSHFVKNERCTLCMDATGELADFSCGDAWLKDRDRTSPWSIIIARSQFAEKYIEELLAESKILCEKTMSEEQVIEAQKLNITSKKYRQYKRIKVRDFLLCFSPEWYDNFFEKGGSYFSEIKIILSKARAKFHNR